MDWWPFQNVPQLSSNYGWDSLQSPVTLSRLVNGWMDEWVDGKIDAALMTLSGQKVQQVFNLWVKTNTRRSEITEYKMSLFWKSWE